MNKKRIAIICTHPIQYNVPLFRLINESDVSFIIKVFYTLGQSSTQIFDKEFGIDIQWDIPLLDGYDSTFVNNTSSNPTTKHFNGVINPTLITEIKDWKADAILVYGWAFAGHLKAIRHFYKRLPVIFRGDSTLLDEPAGVTVKKLVRRTFLKWVYHHVDYALYVGTANYKYFIAHGLKPDQLFFAPHAIDNNRFASEENKYDERAQKWRQDLGIQNHEIVYLFAAKLITKKDPEILIKAFLSLNKTNTRLVIVGNGELENDLKEKYGKQSNVILIDFQNQSIMPVLYRVGDVFVLPSKGPGETWGLAVNEAMACRSAVIVSDKCGCSSDLIKDDNNGYFFKHGDEVSLVNVMSKAANKFKDLGNQSYELIKEWNYSKTIAQLETIVKKQLLDEES